MTGFNIFNTFIFFCDSDSGQDTVTNHFHATFSGEPSGAGSEISEHPHSHFLQLPNLILFEISSQRL